MNAVVELAEWTPDAPILGNVHFREIRLSGHQQLPGHEHNFAHASAVVRDGVRVDFEDVKTGRKWSETHWAPSRFEVPAHVRHTVTALTAHGAEMWCIFAVRDEDGGVAYEVTAKHHADSFAHERLGGGA